MRGENQNRETCSEVMAVVQGGLEQDGSSAGGEKWLDFEYFKGQQYILLNWI